MMESYASVSIFVLFVFGEAFPAPDCFTQDKSWIHDPFIDSLSGIESPTACQVECIQNQDCTHFTWSTEYFNVCYLFSNPGELYSKANSMSGPRICPDFTTTAPPVPHCLRPYHPSTSGYWYCPLATTTCHLECHPGYVAESFTKIDCDPATNSWTHNPDNLTCVPALAMITGGQYSHNTPLGHSEVYGTGVHVQLPPMPQYRESHSLDYVDSHVLACGDFYNDVDDNCVEFTGDGWTFHSTMRTERKGHSSAVMLGMLVLIGGQTSSETSEYLLPSAGSTWQPGIDLALSTWNSCSMKIDADLHIVTGGVEAPNEVWKYNISSGEHVRLADMNHGRHSHGCAFIRVERSNKIGLVVAGGVQAHQTNAIDSTEFYSFERGDWAVWGALNMDRKGLRLAVVEGGTVLAFGGGPGGAQRLASVERLDLDKEAWEYAEDMLEPRKFHAVTIVPSTIMKKIH